MARAIIYCERCGKLILQSEQDSGRALVGETVGVCPACVDGLKASERKEVKRRLSAEPATKRAATPAAGAIRSRATTTTKPRPSGRAEGETVRRSARPRSRTGLVVAVVAAAGLAGVSMAFFVTSRDGEEPGETPGPPPAARTGGGTGPDRGGGAPGAGLDPARKRLDEIRAMVDRSLTRYADVHEALEEFAREFPDPPCSIEARELLAKIRADFDAMAEEAFKKAAEKARALAAEKKPDEAKKALADVGDRFGASEWFTSRGEEAIAGELAKVEEERGKVARPALARAQKALDAGEFGKAREALDDRAAWPQEFRERAEKFLKTIDETAAKLALEAKRKKAWAEFLLGFADAGRKNLAEAKGYIERERQALERLGPEGEIKDRLARLEGHFRKVRLVEDLAEVGFRGARGTIYFRWKGERVAGKATSVEKGVVHLTTTRGKRASIPVAEVAGPDVIRFAKLMRPESGQKLTAATYLLLRGETEAAREAAKDATGDAAWALGDEIGEFTAALGARREREEAAGAAAKVAKAAKAATEAKAAAETEKEDKAKALKESLVSHWKLDDADGTAVKDSARAGNDGIVRGEAKWTDGKLGGALEFDGKKTKVEIANESTYDFTKSMTVAAWIRVEGWATDWQPIVAKGNTAWRLQRAARLDSLIFVCNWPRIKVIGSVDVNDGLWHHVAGTFDGTTMCLYVDGVLDNSARTKGRIATSMAKVGIGYNSALGRYWKGRIDDVRIHDIALPANEIRRLAGGLKAFLVAHWKFDAEEHPQPDASGRGHDATVNGATWTANGRLGGALEFDGEGGHVALPEGFANFTRGITVAVWAYPTSNGSHARFIEFGNGPGKDNIIFMREKRTPGLDFHCYRGKKQLKSVLAKNTLEWHKWQHFAATLGTDGKAVIYKNGRRVASAKTKLPNKVKRTRNFIGKSNWDHDDYYKGRIDDVRVYNRKLSAKEIAKLVPASKPPGNQKPPGSSPPPQF